MLSREHIGAMRNAPDVTMSADMRRLLIEHIDDQQAAIDAAVLETDKWREVARLTQNRLQGQLDALRKHAESLLKTLIVIRKATKEEGSRWAASEAVNTYCTAYPKEDSDAESAV